MYFSLANSACISLKTLTLNRSKDELTIVLFSLCLPVAFTIYPVSKASSFWVSSNSYPYHFFPPPICYIIEFLLPSRLIMIFCLIGIHGQCQHTHYSLLIGSNRYVKLCSPWATCVFWDKGLPVGSLFWDVLQAVACLFSAPTGSQGLTAHLYPTIEIGKHYNQGKVFCLEIQEKISTSLLLIPGNMSEGWRKSKTGKGVKLMQWFLRYWVDMGLTLTKGPWRAMGNIPHNYLPKKGVFIHWFPFSTRQGLSTRALPLLCFQICSSLEWLSRLLLACWEAVAVETQVQEGRSLNNWSELLPDDVSIQLFVAARSQVKASWEDTGNTQKESK